MPNFKYKLLQTARGITVSMAFLQLLKGCFSIVFVMVSASLFGAGIDRDSWVIGWSVQILVFKLLFGPINEIFRAQFLHLKQEKGETNALNAGFSLVMLLTGVSICVIIIFFRFRFSIVDFFAPGYISPDERIIIGRMILLLIPTLVISELITILLSILNSYKSFFLPEIFGVFSVAFNIVLLLIFSSYWGIYTLVIANYTSGFVFVGLLLHSLVKKKIIPSVFRFSVKGAIPFFIFSAPLYISYFFGQLNAWVERVLVSYLEVGNTSALDYARKFIDMPITIIIGVGATIMTPLLADIWIREKGSVHFQHNFFVYLRLGLLLISPIVLWFSICSVEIIELLLHRGSFNASWVLPTANTLKWFGLGLFGVVSYVISGQALLIQKKSFHYAIVGISAQIIPVAINYFFYQKYGLEVFGLSWCIAQYLCGIIMFLYVKALDKTLLFPLLKLIFILAMSMVLCYFIYQINHERSALLRIGIISIAWMLIILLSAKIFKIEEFKSLKNLFQTKK
jgi:putative peptidoglycan lipid II flippase